MDQDNCITTSEDSIIEFRANSTGNVIEMVSMDLPPNMSYKDLNDTHYQWCGPMSAVVQQFVAIGGYGLV